MSRPLHCSTCSFPKTTSPQESSISLTEIVFRIEYREKNGHLIIRYIMYFEKIMTVADTVNICACIPMHQW